MPQGYDDYGCYDRGVVHVTITNDANFHETKPGFPAVGGIDFNDLACETAA